jgi:glycopeptide antibiotics resistance protein
VKPFRNNVISIAATLLAVLTLLLSWLPNPNIGSLPIFPKGIGKWINHYGNLRTAVPFFLIAFLLEFSLEENSNYRKWILPGSLFLVTLAEAGQLVLPRRHFDVWDIFWGMAGAFVGMGAGIVAREVARRVSKRSGKV